MKRLLFAVTVALLCGGAWGLTSAHGAGLTIYVSNESSLTDAEVAAALPAFQTALDRDFAPAWGADATLVQLPTGQEASPDTWVVHLLDYTDDWFALGYHDVHAGVPYAQVGTAMDDWRITFTHELFEMLADPFVDRLTRVGHRYYLQEVCDPVENDSFAYQVDGVPVSDFVLPSYYRRRAKGPFDFAGAVKRPFQLLSEGFLYYWASGDWHEVDA